MGIDRAERWNSEILDLYPTPFLHTQRENGNSGVCVCVVCCVLCKGAHVCAFSV